MRFKTWQKIITFLFVLVNVSGLFLTGCAAKDEAISLQSDTVVYYLSEDEMELVPVKYEFANEDSQSLLTDMINELSVMPERQGVKQLLPDEVTINSYSLDDNIIRIDFSQDYNGMSTSREVLVRCGYVRTLMQIPDARAVYFSVDGADLLDENDKAIGQMTADTFVENTGKSLNTYVRSDIVLYFADAAGSSLVSEGRAIYYSNSKSLEWAIVERLIAGPKAADHYRVVPADTRIISVTVQESCCYVNLSQEFTRGLISGVSPDVTVYAIVDSILRNCDVEKVQISVEGDSAVMYGDTMDLSQIFEKKNIVLPS